jgi:hypothetical protein
MRLSDFQWSRNPRGLHCMSAFQSPLPFELYTRPQMGWVKLVAAGYEFVDDAAQLISMGMTPVVRLYVERWGARPFTAELQGITRAFLAAGVKWFEFYNEPNLGIEWPEGVDPTWEDTGGIIAPLVENWLVFAEYVASYGGYPGTISLAESDAPRYAAVRWMDALLNYKAQYHQARFRNLLDNGVFCATHPYILNHFYQQMPGGGPTSARPPELQNAREGGWHFEYPYDPISQANDPGRTVYGGTPRTPYGDPVGLIAMGRMFNERCAVLFGSQAVPVLGTEGGIWGFRDQVYQQDTRFPPYNEISQAEATVAMFEWIAREAPPWFFGVCLWKEDEYYRPSEARAIGRLAETPVIPKDVPPIEVLAGPPMTATPTPSPTAPGPGPIMGQADLHFVVLAPGLMSEWFFDTARAYWNQFRPTVTRMTELIGYLPSTVSLAVTLIAPADFVPTLRGSLEARYPNVYIDVIEAQSVEYVAAVLADRARRGLPFG